MENEALSIKDCRQEVKDFAVAMENKLRANCHKRSWEDLNFNYFLIRLDEELDELNEAYIKWLKAASKEPAMTPDFKLKVRSAELSMALEAADVANFALFVYSMAMSGRYWQKEAELLAEIDSILKLKRNGMKN